MELIETAAIGDGALLLIDTAPIVYILERHPRFAIRFAVLDSSPRWSGRSRK